MAMPIRRRQFLAASAAAATMPRSLWPWAPAVPAPTPQQLRWQQDELAMFVHFGMNTFTGVERGDGTESPALFNPTRLDAHQWVQTAKAAGFRAMILVAKHHDGFCLWPSRVTNHTVAASPWRDGKGDVVREFVEACRGAGLAAGLYLSPWDRHEPSYGDSPKYNDFYCAQLSELLTGYGPLQEVWFDGANGEGPNGKKQDYDWPRIWGTVKRLQPKALIFSDAGPDIRWIGNEAGTAGDPDWGMVDPAVVTVPGGSGVPGGMRMLQHGSATGTVWRPGEADVSIRPGWFYHSAEDGKVKTPERLVELYFSSVGRNAKLLLNVPPTPAGLFHDADIATLQGMRTRLDAIFARDSTAGTQAKWTVTGERSGLLEVDLGTTTAVAVADLREDVRPGQWVESYQIEAQTADGWRAVIAGTTIGVRKLDRFPPVTTPRLRVGLTTRGDKPRRVEAKFY